MDHCYLCREEITRPVIFFKTDAFSFLECPHCGFVWLPKSSWPADQEGYYSEQYYPEGYAGRDNLAKLFSYRFQTIKRYFKPSGNVLEVGAGSGDFLHLLEGAGYRVEGVELSKRAALQAKQKYGLTLHQGTLAEAAFPDEYFDYIVMYHVLEHVPSPREVLQEARRILKPGGRILIEVPNVRSIDTLLARRLLLNVLDYPNHLYAFSRATLRRLVEEAGFATLGLHGGFPFLLARYMTKLRQLFSRKSGASSVASSVPSGKDLLEKAAQDSMLKQTLQQILPGMKITIVAEKST